MPLSIGDRAPVFSLPQKPRDMVDLEALIGRGPIVLLFFPLAFSPVCTAEMCHMRDTWSQWSEIGATVLGISVDSPFVAAKFREEQQIPFPILSDFNKDVSASYGALHDELFGMRGVSKRAAFVIGRDGTLRYAWVSDEPGQQVPFDDVLSAVATA
ncbi:MAG TPA: redoxin domain-containing protein [Phycisphaerales bacterium]|nr:redoxin domain-containing protein [Phycisphaerales bacterium]HMP37092.1 redoxin domain-containing protein [Phycisphaerales bacterium]